MCTRANNPKPADIKVCVSHVIQIQVKNMFFNVFQPKYVLLLIGTAHQGQLSDL